VEPDSSAQVAVEELAQVAVSSVLVLPVVEQPLADSSAQAVASAAHAHPVVAVEVVDQAAARPVRSVAVAARAVHASRSARSGKSSSCARPRRLAA
jgi:hypothetical protein